VIALKKVPNPLFSCFMMPRLLVRAPQAQPSQQNWPETGWVFAYLKGVNLQTKQRMCGGLDHETFSGLGIKIIGPHKKNFGRGISW